MRIKKNKSLFLQQFGDTPKLRVLDFLIDNHFFDYPLTEIAKGSNVSYNSLKLFIHSFIGSGIIVKTRKIGKSDYYKLNIDNFFIKNLMKLDWLLARGNILLESEENKVVCPVDNY
jgi:predicted transcriptional regulator